MSGDREGNDASQEEERGESDLGEKEKMLSSSGGKRTAAPLELSADEDDSAAWRNMDVRSSRESGGLLVLIGAAVRCVIAFASVLFLAAVAATFYYENHGYRDVKPQYNNNHDSNGPVAPILGRAYLSPDEFRDVRRARPGESVLVTGGLGFIGSHAVDLLLHRGFKVTILDDESNGHNHNRFARELVPHDITIVGDLPEFPTGEDSNDDQNANGDDDKNDGRFTHVIHLAAAISVAESMTDPEKYERVNFGGSQKVLNWIADYNRHVSSLVGAPGPIRKVVAASSAAIYGDPDPSLLPLRETAPYGGLSPYADTKFRMEGLMRDFVDAQNVESAEKSSPSTSAAALRFFNVYGPRQDPKNPYSGVISLFLEMAMSGRDITVLGDGMMTRDFVYVKDVARAIVLALLRENDGKGKEDAGEGKAWEATFDVYNVCTGKTITINTLAEQVKQSMESHSEVVHLDPREGDIRDSSCNPAKARKGIGFVSAMDQRGGLKKTAEWFRLEEDKRRNERKASRTGRRLEEAPPPRGEYLF